ncbi:hypothetical protein [Methylorubrum podarium]|jgi:hypothetical protein|uniref:hypothetical protein n=1 Tax=Methylorubrum podarium TaxID=200476 RepID=UPI001EE36148|nr:hypothetical protein [Methylorubrum podarium]GJE73215.1 hypothetical protein CHKEEEPN_4779 [Methylorubrum podarium]
MRLPLLFATLLLTGSALAQDAQPPAQQALAHMVGEAQQREANGLLQIYALRAEIAAEKRRAEQAESRLKAYQESAGTN